MNTKIAIIGAGPAGLMLSHLLAQKGIDSVILERRSQKDIEETVRAGVLEQGTIELMRSVGLEERMNQIGYKHEGINIQFNQERHRIDFPSLTNQEVMVYPQHEVIKDLLNARQKEGASIYFEVEEVELFDIESKTPSVEFTQYGERYSIHCDYIAGCDGFHGPSRKAIPSEQLKEYEHTYDHGWLGILAETAPASEELVYTHHPNGFALLSTRTPTLQRFYLQVDRTDHIDNWSDERIWEELRTRVDLGNGPELQEGRITSKNIVAMKSYVCETMHYGSLFLAGDAAHIVPPTGAKGMNLAMSDVQVLAQGLIEYYQDNREELLNSYEAIALRRVWKAQRFSAFMTKLLHPEQGASPYELRLQESELDYLVSSKAAQQSLAENYTGLPIEWEKGKKDTILS
ncbi:4-hydroxybenzoate 3-monooxygenase [Marinococcus halophilus]|uniref:4-hydroxybenzoate 3-monooxygenase n=1 Tax=Marinococcus halophilus TaxID=1371 RepID=A0A510YBD1_MARHA|nr:4-hydroxybenzoate 3-monooxygenase [Marinococcus halophilus]OZT79065.1 4-hydroxybenzoate 3-monooxygenase [Marinococcus halophilus]GEK59951.1 4-hydroxybenzoate 3-monooxygenase [Marinococcus halophilus]